jgi:pimeloyl-ACP methyl ester carboxylesterase
METHSEPHSAYEFGLQLPEGLVLRVRQWGTRGHICLLLHGFGEGSYVWGQFAPLLQDCCRVLAVDLRGHGDSDWDPAADYGTCRYAADLMYVIETLALNRFVVVGHSLGGELAIHLASCMPERVAALAVVDYGPQVDKEVQAQSMELFRAGFRAYASIEEYASWLESTRPMLHRRQIRLLAQAALREVAEGRFLLKCDPSLVHVFDRLAPTEASARAIRCPVLLVRGSQSAILAMKTAERLVGLFGNGKLIVVPKAGHAVMVDNPVGFSQAVMPFVKRHGRDAVHGSMNTDRQTGAER